MATRRLTRRLAGVISKFTRDLQLNRVADHRSRRGRRHKLIQPLIVALIAGMVCGRKGLAEVEELTSDLSSAARRLLGIGKRFADTTLRHQLLRLGLDDLRDALRRGVLSMGRSKALQPAGLPFGAVSMDGRSTSTNSWDPDDAFAQLHHPEGGAVYALVRTITTCLISSAARICLDMHPIPAKTNENGVFSAAFAAMVEHFGHLFRVVLYDSGANAAANARWVLTYGKDYLFRVQAEQPTIYDECKRCLGSRPVSTTNCVGSYIHGGKVVTRHLWFDENLAGWHDYPGLRCAIRLCSVSEDKATGERTTENRYYITSLPASALSKSKWGELIRRHWSVENNCHNTWDKLFREDKRPWVRLPRGMLNVMVLRRIAYNMMAWFREVAQRGEHKRQTPWKRLMTLFRDALVGLSDDALLSPRPLKVLAFD